MLGNSIKKAFFSLLAARKKFALMLCLSKGVGECKSVCMRATGWSVKCARRIVCIFSSAYLRITTDLQSSGFHWTIPPRSGCWNEIGTWVLAAACSDSCLLVLLICRHFLCRSQICSAGFFAVVLFSITLWGFCNPGSLKIRDFGYISAKMFLHIHFTAVSSSNEHL